MVVNSEKRYVSNSSNKNIMAYFIKCKKIKSIRNLSRKIKLGNHSLILLAA